ncbi:EAL domain-containing protein [Marinomonas sp. 2405UD68-3]|uniref:bifunctional diguanylate cyclase/phosphodiesterase n=1 Tax=Marinomonas sp. 2405UD68-3 TaxID=3391835 RepID=UPI0039C97900
MYSKDYLNKSYLLVFFLIAFCGFVATFNLYQQEKNSVAYEQGVVANRFVSALSISLNNYAIEVAAIVALFDSVNDDTISHEQFSRFSDSLLEQNLNPISNVYFAKFIRAEEVDDFLLEQKKIMKHQNVHIFPEGERAFYLPLTYGFPDVMQHGADLLSNELPYKDSVQLAIDSKKTVMTPPLTLANDKVNGDDEKNAFILRHAVFNQQGELKGIVGIAFKIDGLLDQIDFFSGSDVVYRFADVTDQKENDAPHWFYDTSQHQLHSLKSTKMHSSTLDFAGRTWLVESCSLENPYTLMPWNMLIFLVVTYLFLAILVSFFIYKLSRAYSESLEKAEYFLSTDELTNLKSRHEINHQVTQQVVLASDHSTFAVMLLDLDHFKTINDAFGYFIGDKLLVKVSQRLLSVLPDGAHIGRVGGDEFLVILPTGSTLDRERLIALAQDIIDQVSKSYLVDERILTIGCSVGISTYPEFGEDAPTLMKNVDMAMHKAKTLGRSTYHFYDSEMGGRLIRNVLIETRLRLAMQNNQLELYFQPKVDLKTLRCIGLESLLRWDDDELGAVSPAEFIPIAERSGIILPLGEWVIEQACIHIAQWRDRGEFVPPIAINCSAAQLKRADFLERLVGFIEKYEIDTSFIELEVTESILIEDAEGCAKLLSEVSRLGMKISLDDFGTGYSSLSYLKDLPFDCVKIDQVFIRDILDNEKHAALVRGTIQMSHSFGLNVVSEGITDDKQLALLREYGCDFGQGYLFGKAYPPDLVASKIEP